MTSYAQVQHILSTAVGGVDVPVPGPHGAFWRTRTRDQFVQFSLFGLPVVTPGDGSNSTLVKALRGQEPFGQDTGNPGASFRRMPAGRPPVPDDQIAVISAWIDDGCPGETEQPLGSLEVLLEGASSGETFLIVSGPGSEHTATANLTVRTADGSQGEVTCRVRDGSAAELAITPTTLTVTGTPSEVRVAATSASAAHNDTAVEIVHGGAVLARFDVTAIRDPAVRFAGRFQCRLATDPDPYDHPWGERSSFGVYAVEGPDPSRPDEPPLDRIVRFHDAVALRPFCGPVGVAIVAVEAAVGGSPLRFTRGDPIIGQPVRLGPNCVFDSRNRTFAPDGFEPIANFSLEVGSVLSGASAAAVPRPDPIDPPGSTAPYANGISRPDLDPAGPRPSDFGYPEATWAERSWATVARKLARLVAEQPSDDRGTRIRARRIQEHAVQRLAAIGFPIQLMERYTGLIDRDLSVLPDAGRTLAFLDTGAIEIQLDFLDFDTDCQTGTVTGVLRAPVPTGEPRASIAAPTVATLRRRAPLDEQ